MTETFLSRLRARTDLGEAELEAMAALPTGERTFGIERLMVTEGERPDRVHILVDGWAARVKVLPDGRRHLASLLVPGDLCDIDALYVAAYDYGVVALTRCIVTTVERQTLLDLFDRHPPIARAFAWLGYIDNSMLNEAATSLARRSARQRLSHLICELALRLEAVGRGGRDGFDLPVTQEKIADALGLTGVHVNRTVQLMRADGMIASADRFLGIPDWDALTREAGFSAGYLHLEGMRAG